MNKRLNAVIACSALLAAMPAALAQNDDSKPSPYVGVSQPPPDDTIVSTPDPAPVKPRPARQAAATDAQSTYTVQQSDPDAGIVTVPVSQNYSQPNYREPVDAGFHQRSANPDAGIVTFVSNRPGELPEGTNIHVRLAQELSSRETRPGTAFSGQVAKDVTLDGRVVIPEGSELRGRVASVREGHRFGNSAAIRLRPDAIILPDGSRYALHAAVIATRSHNAKVDGEGGITTKSRLKKNTVEEGIGAGTGAVTGAALAGGAGALVGSVVGVGVVTTHLLVQPPQTVNLPSNTTVVFSLTEPLALTPYQN